MQADEVLGLLGDPAASVLCQDIEASDCFTLRVYSFTPKGGGTGCPVVFIPGWTSVMEGWAPLLSAWVEQREIHYIETREKRSATIERRVKSQDFSMPRHVADLAEVLEVLGLGKEVLWFGSSLGATVILEGLMQGHLQGRGAFLISPNSAFIFPTWMVPLTWMPWWFYHPIIRAFIPYLKWRLKEPAQYQRYRRTLFNADLKRLKCSVIANRAYTLPDGLDRITIPVAICVAASDTLHSGDDAHGTAAALPNGKLVEVESNQYAHEAAVIFDIESWEKRACD